MSESQSFDPWTQLMVLQEQTRLFGGLHDAQVLQLKMYPLMCFETPPGSAYFEADIVGRLVRFHVAIDSRYSREEAHRRSVILDRATKSLLGPEWTVGVYVGVKHLRPSVRFFKFLFKGKIDGVSTGKKGQDRPEVLDSKGRSSAEDGGKGELSDSERHTAGSAV